MNGRRLLVTAAFGLWLGFAPVMAAQTPPADAQPQTRPLFGVLVGGESVPSGLDRTCGNPTGRRGLAVLGAFLVVPVGPIGLQGRINGRWRGTVNCAVLDSGGQTGTTTNQVPDVPEGSFTTLDLSMRWPPASGGLWVVGAGVGWAASSKDVPYVTTSLGLRSATQPVRWGADLELNAYRVPWKERTTEYSDGSATVLSSRSYKKWASTIGLRITVEIPVVHEEDF